MSAQEGIAELYGEEHDLLVRVVGTRSPRGVFFVGGRWDVHDLDRGVPGAALVRAEGGSSCVGFHFQGLQVLHPALDRFMRHLRRELVVSGVDTSPPPW